MRPEDADVSLGRFLVLAPDGRKLLQTGCWHIASKHTDIVEGAECWRLSLVPGGKPLRVKP